MSTASMAAAAEGLPKFQTDPLLDTISAYRRGLADFDANAPIDDDDAADAYAAISYLPPARRLATWTDAAVTREGAIAALQVALDENALGDNFICDPMIKAALAFLRTAGGVAA